MKRIYAAPILALMMETFAFENVTHQKCVDNPIGNDRPFASDHRLIIAEQIKIRSAIWVEVPGPFPTSGAFLDFGPESLLVCFGQHQSSNLGRFHKVRTSGNRLEPCEGNKGQAPLGQPERLNPVASIQVEDAIVRSHGKMNHERLAEMTNLRQWTHNKIW